MMIQYQYLIIGALILVAMYIHVRSIRQRERHLDAYASAMDEFYSAADVLISDDDTPHEVLRLLQFMKTKAAERRSARQFIWYLLVRRNELFRPIRIASIEAFLKRRPELAEAFGNACNSAFEAMAYHSPLAGKLLRKYVLFDVKRNRERAEELAESYREIECHDHHQDDQLVRA